MPTPSLTWSHVAAWRLSQHHLLERADRKKLLNVVNRIGGVQAQVMSAAELALWARVEGLSSAEVQNALWQKRTLIKTWAMRGTLHLIAASELPLYVAARGAYPIHRTPSYYTYHGVTPAELEAIIDGLPKTLSDKPMTREQLADGLAKRARKPGLREALLSGWGALLKPSAFRGDICFGPSQGQNVTFVRPSEWARKQAAKWKPIEPPEAQKEIARLYLTAYGPATTDDFARWWGLEASQAKKTFRSLGDEIEAVEVEGWKAWVLASTLEQMKALKATRSLRRLVRLLPQFDAYVLGVARDCEPLLPKKFKARVYRPQGWVSAVVLVDGRMEGVWDYDQQRAGAVVIKVEMFALPSPAVKRGVQAEVRRLGNFLESEVELTFA